MANILRVKQNGVWVEIPAIKGDTGPQGAQGETGEGVPSGGTTGQILQKKSGTNYDTEWVDKPTSGVWGQITGTLSDQTDLSNALSGKVDVISGKGLSTNDYDNTEKQKVTDAYAAKHTHDNKALLDTYTQTEVDLADAVTKKHTHSNKSLLDSLEVATQEEVYDMLFIPHATLTSSSGVFIVGELVDVDEYVILEGVQG